MTFTIYEVGFLIAQPREPFTRVAYFSLNRLVDLVFFLDIVLQFRTQPVQMASLSLRARHRQQIRASCPARSCAAVAPALRLATNNTIHIMLSHGCDPLRVSCSQQRSVIAHLHNLSVSVSIT